MSIHSQLDNLAKDVIDLLTTHLDILTAVIDEWKESVCFKLSIINKNPNIKHVTGWNYFCMVNKGNITNLSKLWKNENHEEWRLLAIAKNK